MYAPKCYMNQAGFAATIKVVPQAVPHRLAAGLVPDPDVYVGQVTLEGKVIRGWTAERVRAYREFTRPYVTPSGLRLPEDLELPEWWYTESEWYLNQREAAAVLGLESGSMSMRLTRGTFPVAPKVMIGDKHYGQARGWDMAELIAYGENRYLVNGKIAATGQKGPPRKAVDPDFYRHRARNLSKLAGELAVAA